MPISLTFGPWSPDLANNPVEIPDTQGPVPIPCADVLNVFFSNGSYKSIASPAPAVVAGSTAQVLPAPVLAAFSYYDNVAQAQTVFAGSASGLEQLNTDGSWSVVPFLTFSSAALIGQAMGFTIGNLGNTDALRGIRVHYSPGQMIRSIAGVSIVAGQIVNVANVQKTGFGNPGQGNAFGTCAHPLVLTGTLVALFDLQPPSSAATSLFSIISATDPGANAFVNIKANGKTFTAASASYSYVTTTATWVFPTIFGFAPGTTYPVTFT